MDVEQEIINIKATLIGKSGVGKTCIIRRYTDDFFDPNTKTTPGASYSQKTLSVDNKQIILDIWDTAGQEQYRALGRHFYKDAYIVCLVYDITNRSSFDDLKSWYEDLKTYGEKYTITAIVGNKSDMYESEEVEEEEARKYAQEINSPFFLVSAKKGDNISLLFKTLVSKYFGPEFEGKIRESLNEKGIIDSTNIKVVKDKKEKIKKKKKCC